MDRHGQSVLLGPHPGNRADAFDEPGPFCVIHLLGFFRTSGGGCTTVRDGIDQDQVFCSVGFEGLAGSNRTIQGVFPFFRIMKGTEHHPADQGQVS